MILVRLCAEVSQGSWIHTSLCTFLENTLAITAIRLGICLAFHIEIEKLLKNSERL